MARHLLGPSLRRRPYPSRRGLLPQPWWYIKNNIAGFHGGGVAAENSTATTLTQTAVTANHAGPGAGGVYRLGGTMTTSNSPITANTPNNCVGSAPAVPNCTA